MNQWTPRNLLIVAGVAAVGVYLVQRKVSGMLGGFSNPQEAAYAAGQQVRENLNPTNPDNIINRGFNDLYGTVTGSDGTLGTDVADWVNDPDRWWN